MALLDPILGPLLRIEPIWTIAIISLFVAIISVLATKFMTNQELMKSHRAELKNMQKKMREMRDDPKKAMALQKKMMEINMVVMKESFKPMLITIIPFILIFAWLNANFSYIPISPGEEFIIEANFRVSSGEAFIEIIPENSIEFISGRNTSIENGKSVWKIKGEEGIYTINFKYNDQTVSHDLIIGDSYSKPEERHAGDIRSTKISYEPLRINILGLNMKWIWSYIIFSLVFSIFVRKILKVH